MPDIGKALAGGQDGSDGDLGRVSLAKYRLKAIKNDNLAELEPEATGSNSAAIKIVRMPKPTFYWKPT